MMPMKNNMDREIEICGIVLDYKRVAKKLNRLYELYRNDPDVKEYLESLPTDYKVDVNYTYFSDSIVVTTRSLSSAFKRTRAMSIIEIPYDVSKKELKQIKKLFGMMTGLEKDLDELIEDKEEELAESKEEENS